MSDPNEIRTLLAQPGPKTVATGDIRMGTADTHVDGVFGLAIFTGCFWEVLCYRCGIPIPGRDDQHSPFGVALCCECAEHQKRIVERRDVRQEKGGKS